MVVTDPLLLVDVVVLCAPTETSRGFTVSEPLYSAMRISGKRAPTLKVTVTVLAPAAAAKIFFA